MTTQGKAMAAAAGVAPEAATARILGAMRYAGQGFQVEAEIPAEAITRGDAAMLRAKFEAAYLALYGRTEPALPVECVSWQVIVAGPRPILDLTQQGAAAEGALPRGTRRAWFGGAYVAVPVLNRLALRPGESIAGPALIEERECTLVLTPGASACCDAALNLDVTLPA
jgi:N-methylhydantoinase A/oxoprolinase/acetone carboxylase beta subunit